MVYIDTKRSTEHFPGGHHMYALDENYKCGMVAGATGLLGYDKMGSSVMGPAKWKDTYDPLVAAVRCGR